MPDPAKILCAVQEGVGLITVNQPEKRNAMSTVMWGLLADALDRLAADPSVQGAVLRGAGGKAFVSGADLTEKPDPNEPKDAAPKRFQRGLAALRDFPKPLIAQIEGFCLGGGMAIALLADMRIAADDARFGIPASKLGRAYNYDLVARLVGLVGEAEARMLLLLGEPIDAAEALRIGLVQRVVPKAQLAETVAGMARTIAGNAPLSVRGMKQIINDVARHQNGVETPASRAAVEACNASQDIQEGRIAFGEKRPPRFTGR